MSGHKFKIGQLVYYLGREGASSVYQVTQLLPPEGEAFQYRIKNVNEPRRRYGDVAGGTGRREGAGW